MNRIHEGVIIECQAGNIASQPGMDAVVNAANAALMPGGGVAGAIHRKAGPGLAAECKPLAPIKPGEAVITSAHNLPNKYVVHCLGPVYGKDKPSDILLGNCYQNALKLTEVHKVKSIVFPAISAGVFGYPMEEAARVAFSVIIKTLPSLNYLKKIRFVLYNNDYLNIHEKVLEELIPQ